MPKKHPKAWIERHTCLECGKVQETTDDNGKCYVCRNKYHLKPLNWKPVTSGVCKECKKDSETLYRGFCLKCRRKFGFTKMRERINKKDSKFGIPVPSLEKKEPLFPKCMEFCPGGCVECGEHPPCQDVQVELTSEETGVK